MSLISLEDGIQRTVTTSVNVYTGTGLRLIDTIYRNGGRTRQVIATANLITATGTGTPGIAGWANDATPPNVGNRLANAAVTGSAISIVLTVSFFVKPYQYYVITDQSTGDGLVAQDVWIEVDFD